MSKPLWSIDRMLLVFKGMGVKLAKGGETYLIEVTTTIHIYMFVYAKRLPIGTHVYCSGAHREMYHKLLQEGVWMCQSEIRGTRFVRRWSHARNL